MYATSIKLADGYRADWEDNGNRLAVYGPMVGGYRTLTVLAELDTYVPAWGTRRDTVTEWRAYRDWQSRYALDSRPVDSFDSPDAIAAWLESLIIDHTAPGHPRCAFDCPAPMMVSVDRSADA